MQVRNSPLKLLGELLSLRNCRHFADQIVQDAGLARSVARKACQPVDQNVALRAPKQAGSSATDWSITLMVAMWSRPVPRVRYIVPWPLRPICPKISYLPMRWSTAVADDSSASTHCGWTGHDCPYYTTPHGNEGLAYWLHDEVSWGYHNDSDQ